MSLEQDVQLPNPGVLIDLYEVDLSFAGFSVPVMRFYPGTEADYGDLQFDGNSYTPMPITVTGFEATPDGPLPRPIMTVSNVGGAISEQMRQYNDFIGAKVDRIRTFGKYLDNGSSPDPTARMTEVFYVEQKKSENKMLVKFELASPIDIMDKQLPGRFMIANVCSWRYKGVECGWPATNPSLWFDANDQSVGSQNLDACGKTLASCKARFGENAELPYGGWPALGKTR
jgi:lambda family phage minor tail protein L